MSILKVKKESEVAAKVKSDRSNKEPGNPYTSIKIPQAKPRSNLVAFTVIMLGTFVCAAGIIKFLNVGTSQFFSFSNSSDLGVKEAYFELTTVRKNNKPVPGVDVRFGNKYMGKTDALGEWRKYIKVRPGSSYKVSVSKKMGSSDFKSTKNFAIPYGLTKQHEFKHKFIVATQDSSHALTRHENRLFRKSQSLTPKKDSIEEQANAINDKAIEDEIKKLEQIVERATATKNAALAKKRLLQANRDIKPKSVGETALTSKLALKALNENSVWIEKTGYSRPSKFNRQQSIDNVLAAVKAQAVRKGMRLSKKSNLKLILSSLNARTGNHDTDLIKVTVLQDGVLIGAFLKNYGTNKISTANRILSGVSRQVPKEFDLRQFGKRWLVTTNNQNYFWRPQSGSYVYNKFDKLHLIQNIRGQLFVASANSPCGRSLSCKVTMPGPSKKPPIVGWARQRLNSYGKMPSRAEVYAAGYQAVKQDGTYYYWGPKNKHSFLTVVNAGKVIFRNKVFNDPSGTSFISLPRSPVAGRK